MNIKTFIEEVELEEPHTGKEPWTSVFGALYDLKNGQSDVPATFMLIGKYLNLERTKKLRELIGEVRKMQKEEWDDFLKGFYDSSDITWKDVSVVVNKQLATLQLLDEAGGK